jgi:pyruvate,orthophosphate dikinase
MLQKNTMFYYFSPNYTQGHDSMRDILGGKGAGLAVMCNLGAPIPPGFTISTELCRQYFKNNNRLPDDFQDQLRNYLAKLEQDTGKKFGSLDRPLLVSVRSGASISMPGMMESILNLGINDSIAENWSKQNNNPIFVYDTYRRFLQMFGSIALEIPEILARREHLTPATLDSIQQEISQLKQIINRHSPSFNQEDLFSQLVHSIEAVLRSWMSPRAYIYRKLNKISDEIGTAVTIQTMVFGNLNDKSASGVAFTRNPSTGEKKLFGEFLIQAQGEEIVDGTSTPLPILLKTDAENDHDSKNDQSWFKLMPQKLQELQEWGNILERHFQDMQDIEFTIEDDKLYILQSRSGKRSASATVKIAVDMVAEGIISKQDAIMTIGQDTATNLIHTNIDYSQDLKIHMRGLPASPGAASGMIVFSADDAQERGLHNKVILVRNDTSPEDIKGMHVSAGILTARGGMTSHAAVVARGMGRPCVCSVQDITINEQERSLTTKSGVVLQHGDLITIDGSNGNIIIGEAPLLSSQLSPEFYTILSWADEEARLTVRANAENAQDAKTALEFGAKGIGLCRTEHMFFEREKLPLIRQMIIAQTYEQRKIVIDKLRPLQIQDFVDLFEIMNGLPLNIRLLDPPLHEFLPHRDNQQELEHIASELGMQPRLLQDRLQDLHEANPMLGHRGVRLGITHPEIYAMQVEAILEAMHIVEQSKNIRCNLELMIPLISSELELILLKEKIEDIIGTYEKKLSIKFNIKIGTMIEVPRAALLADKIAKYVDYFSFGSNDLTQMTYGISRDDVRSFLPEYLEHKIFSHDPFTVLDQEGVGQLIKMAIERGKKTNPGLALGVCGEHAGEPESINFFHNIGIDYISCSPYRIAAARIYAAQSEIIAQVKSR